MAGVKSIDNYFSKIESSAPDKNEEEKRPPEKNPRKRTKEDAKIEEIIKDDKKKFKKNGDQEIEIIQILS